MANLLVLNGPNLQRLGSREPEIYGTADYSTLVADVQERCLMRGIKVEIRQTDSEAELIGWLHEAADAKVNVILNPAAFTHYSYALRDAATLVTKAGAQLIEVHLTNPHSREEFRQKSVISPVASGVIAGFGLRSYLAAIDLIAGE